jgi:hypothetical protein
LEEVSSYTSTSTRSKAANFKPQKVYTAADKEVKKSIKKDKKDYRISRNWPAKSKILQDNGI